MNKILAATAIAMALAGCNNGPDETAMKIAIEEAMGKRLVERMQSAMFQGNLTGAMQGMGAASTMSVGTIKKKACEEVEKQFFCDLVVPITVRDQRHDVEAKVWFFYVDKKLVANVNGLI